MSKSLQEKSSYEKAISFFSELSPHIEYASIFDRELDRRVAHKFNVFDFLDKKEIGLSQIIAHLFNPSASHGQGTIFLQHFLKLVTNEENNWNHLDSENIKVETEHNISENRRIDIYAEISGEKTLRLAIENKPYADDEENQVIDYLNYLKEEAKETSNFLLVYISPNGEGPSELSFPEENRSGWEGNFKVMAYAKSDYDSDESFDVQRVIEPLTTWFKTCKKECDVDRLRWFLGDAENFCTKTFGISKSTDDVEVKIVESFLSENPKYMNTAYAVKKAWPSVVNKVAEPYFQQLADSIYNKFAGRKDIRVKVKSSFEERDGYINLWLYSINWVQQENPGRYYDTNGRYCIAFCNGKKHKPDGWYVQVCSPKERNNLNDDEKDRFDNIKEKLKEKVPSLKGGDAETGYMYVDDDKRNWEQYLEILLDETKQKGGIFTDYYVNFFGEIADKAICILDDI